MKKDTTFALLITIFFLISGTFFSMLFFNKNLTVFTRASESQDPSPSSSIVFAWPLVVPSGGSSNITVFVRNDKGNGLANKEVSLTATSGQVIPPTKTTDKTGKAEFKLTAPPGTVKLTASTNNIVIGQVLELTFE
jgi:hypothetical protein